MFLYKSMRAHRAHRKTNRNNTGETNVYDIINACTLWSRYSCNLIKHLIISILLLGITSLFLSGCLGEGKESYQECYTCDDLDCVPPAEEIRYDSPEIVELTMIVEGI